MMKQNEHVMEYYANKYAEAIYNKSFYAYKIRKENGLEE